MRPFIRHQVCNSTGTFLWHDFWNPLGLILPLFEEWIIYDSAIHRNARVVDVMDGSRWNWHVTISADLLVLKNSCADYLLDINREDVISLTQSNTGVFTASSARTPLDLAGLWYTGMQLCGSHSLSNGTPSYPG